MIDSKCFSVNYKGKGYGIMKVYLFILALVLSLSVQASETKPKQALKKRPTRSSKPLTAKKNSIYEEAEKFLKQSNFDNSTKQKCFQTSHPSKSTSNNNYSGLKNEIRLNPLQSIGAHDYSRQEYEIKTIPIHLVTEEEYQKLMTENEHLKARLTEAKKIIRGLLDEIKKIKNRQ